VIGIWLGPPYLSLVMIFSTILYILSLFLHSLNCLCLPSVFTTFTPYFRYLIILVFSLSSVIFSLLSYSVCPLLWFLNINSSLFKFIASFLSLNLHYIILILQFYLFWSIVICSFCLRLILQCIFIILQFAFGSSVFFSYFSRFWLRVGGG
jgi:hypothetical protein